MTIFKSARPQANITIVGSTSGMANVSYDLTEIDTIDTIDTIAGLMPRSKWSKPSTAQRDTGMSVFGY